MRVANRGVRVSPSPLKAPCTPLAYKFNEVTFASKHPED